MKISYRFCLNGHFTKIDHQNYIQNQVIGICMEQSCKAQQFVCQECIERDHSDHNSMISTFDQIQLLISSYFKDTFLNIPDVFDQNCQQQEFQELKQQIYEEFEKLETHFNKSQEQIKILLDAYKIISKIKDGCIKDISVEEFNILFEIFQNQKINNYSALHSNLTLLKNKSKFLSNKVKEIQQQLTSSQINSDTLDFSKFISRNIKQKIISQFYSQNLLNYSLVPQDYQFIKGARIGEIENNNEIYYGEINEKQIKHGKGIFEQQKGVQIIKNGDIIYEGIWESDQLQWGQKTTFNENSECCIFQGKMNNKKLNGFGLKKSSFDYEVKAHFMDDKIQGEGILNTKKGDQYKGEFYENKKHGHGEFHTTKGDRQVILQSRYEGEYWKDKRQGRGTYFFPNGDIYNGQFQDDQMHGKGELKIQNTGDMQKINENSRYTGSFKNNKKEGDFEIKHSNGQMYNQIIKQSAKVTFKNDQVIGNVKSIIQKAIKGSIFHDRKQ